MGDKVLATDPETGETRTETVTAETLGKGVKHLVKVTIDTDGKKGSKTAEVTATEGHPFWVPELGEWIDATDLRTGEWLQTGAGTRVQVTALKRWTALDATVYNLTVSVLHTYYVVADATSVLVHNTSARPTKGGDEVDYGSTDLSQSVIQERLRTNNTGNNFAAARYTDADGISRIAVAYSSKGLGNHAERKLLRQYGDSITEMYSEFQPCTGSNKCRAMLETAGIPTSYWRIVRLVSSWRPSACPLPSSSSRRTRPRPVVRREAVRRSVRR